jgi:hypothetical protein
MSTPRSPEDTPSSPKEVLTHVALFPAHIPVREQRNYLEQAEEFKSPAKRAELHRTVRDSYPTPIALHFHRIHQDLNGRIREPLVTWGSMTNLFLHATQFMTYVCLVSYSAHPDVHSDGAQRSVRRFLKEGGPGLGTWWNVFREVISAFMDHREKLFLSEVLAFYSSQGKENSLYASLPWLRNENWGHLPTVSNEAARNFLDEFRFLFYLVMKQLEFLSNYVVLTPIEHSGSETGEAPFLCRVRAFSGTDPSEPDLELASRDLLQKNRFYLLRMPAGLDLSSTVIQPGDLMELSPFLLTALDQESSRLFLHYQDSKIKKGADDDFFPLTSAEFKIDIGGQAFQRRLDRTKNHTELEHLERLFDAALSSGRSAVPSGRKAVPSPVLKGTLDWDAFVTACHIQSRQHLVNILDKFKYVSSRYVNRGTLEGAFWNFLESTKSGFLLVGGSGMGKTNLVSHLFEELNGRHVPALFVNSVHVDESLDIWRPVQRALSVDGVFESFLPAINEACERRESYLVVLVDAVNEFAAGSLGPSDLFRKLDDMVVEAGSLYPRLKFVITSRIKTWEVASQLIRSSSYFEGKDGVAHFIRGFDEAEAEAAFNKYKTATAYSALSAPARRELRDPLMLRLVMEAYEEKSIPVDRIDSIEVFDRYYRRFVFDDKIMEPEGLDWKLQAIVLDLAGVMALKGTESVLVKRHLGEPAHDDLRHSLEDLTLTSAYVRLVDRGILTESAVNNDRQIRFTYDRFLEYLLARECIRELGQIVEAQGWKDSQKQVVQFFIDRLDRGHHLNTTWAALTQTLLLIHAGLLHHRAGRASSRLVAVDNRDFATLVKSMATSENPRLSSVVVELLTALAARFSSDLESLLTLLLSRSSDDTSLMLLDAAYSILTDDAHRLEAARREVAEVSRQERVLYSVFLRALEGEGRVADRAVQYLYFLWRFSSPDPSLDLACREHALRIIDSAVGDCGITSALTAGGRHMLRNLAGLVLLLIAEGLDEATSVAPVLSSLRALLRNLRVDQLDSGPVLKALTWLSSEVLTRNPNPINQSELTALFATPGAIEELRRVLDYLDPDYTPLDESFFEGALALARSKNSLVYQFLSHALSSKFQIHNTTEGGRILEILTRLFDTGEAVPQYVASIALYHINYFGSRGTPETIQMMVDMARVILTRWKGHFEKPGGSRLYNYNIIGTLGRCVIRHEETLGRPPLSYAIEALEHAKDEADYDYYAYVCENVGLLGAIAPPRKALEVIRYILQDLEEIPLPQDGRDPLPFDRAAEEKLEAMIIKSLGRIRVRFQKDVDRFLLDDLDSEGLFNLVRGTSSSHGLGIYFSWVSEELFEKLLLHVPDFSRSLIRVFREASHQRGERQAVDYVLTGILRTAAHWATRND